MFAEYLIHCSEKLTPVKGYVVTDNRKKQYEKAFKKAHEATAKKAFERYKSVMEGRGWLTQSQIEAALGYASTVSYVYLQKLLSLGIIERRNRGDAPQYNRRMGHEYRWR